jgi:hypothetical protein
MTKSKYKKLFTNQLASQATFPPCYAFSVHKAGSSLMAGMIAEVCKLAAIPALNVPDTLFELGVQEIDWFSDPGLMEVFESRLLHFGFRQLPDLMLEPGFGILQRKCVLLLRDPRDCLVSQYFSYGGQLSHVVPLRYERTFNSRLRLDPALGIDEYVLREAPELKRKIELYSQALSPATTRKFNYEDIFFDKYSFICEIFRHFEIEVADQILATVARGSDIRPEREDQSRHIRQGYPGDFRAKLQPSTISALNEIFF